MKRYILYNILKHVIFIIFVISTIYFYNDLIKKDFSSKLIISNISIERLVKTGKYSSNVQILIQNALPLLNKYKIHILRHPGYWLDIFNTYNQLAAVENFNDDRRAAIKFLLRSLHYHPYLAETYRALAIYLTKIGEDITARSCKNFSDQLIRGSKIDLNLKKICIEKSKKII